MSDWSKNEICVLKVNPARKKAFILHAAVLSGLFSIATIGQAPIIARILEYKEAKVEEAIRPRMASLAAAGKPAAVVWMIQHDYEAAKESGFSALSAAALRGDPQSMLAYGILQLEEGRRDLARIWIEKASDEGNPEAVRFLYLWPGRGDAERGKSSGSN